MKRILLSLNLLIGLGAIAGGIGGIVAPDYVGAKQEMLHNFFPSFVAPSLLLIIFIGLGNLFGLLCGLLKRKSIGYYSIFIGIILILWITIQCLILKSIYVPHIIFFILGILQITIGNKVKNNI